MPPLPLLRIAILDDDSSIRIALTRLLTAEGMAASSHASGGELFEALARENFDCLVLDFEMPGMNALDVLKQLGQRGFAIPAIILTAHDHDGVRGACLKAGAADYMCKPVDADRLITAIKNVCGKSPDALHAAHPGVSASPRHGRPNSSPADAALAKRRPG